MTDIKEFKVDPNDYGKKVTYLLKELLKANNRIKIVGNTASATSATIAAETLKRLGYIEFENVQTETAIEDGRRKTRILITVRKTDNFEKLYQENEEFRKKKEEERKKAEEEKKEGGKK